MSKLDPKPDRKVPYSWNVLNNVLKRSFKTPGTDSVTVRPEQFEMSKDEIISEAEKQGYKVTDNNNGFLKFE